MTTEGPDDGLPTYDELRRRQDAPPGSSWGLWGPDDDIGMVNLLGPTEVCAGVGCIRRGEVFDLDLPLDAFDPPLVPRRAPPRHTITTSGHHRDDHLDGLHLQGSTQLDGLRHIRHARYGFYNGRPDEEVRVGTRALGIDRWAEHGLVGRGVLLDVGRARIEGGRPLDLDASDTIDADDLDATAASQGVELRPGDLVLVRTGWLAHVLCPSPAEGHEREGIVPSPGLRADDDTLRWLWDHRVPLIAMDNLAVEAFPPPGTDGPGGRAGETQQERMLHQELIALLGMALGELWVLDRLAEDCHARGTYDFLLVSKPLKLTGGVGSPANAVAIR